MNDLFRNINKFRRISQVEKALLIRGTGVALFYLFLIHLVPLKHLLPLLEKGPKRISAADKKEQYIKITGKTIRRIEKTIPFQLSCLVKSILFKMLLNKLGIESKIELGVCKSGIKALQAHAYVVSDDIIIYLKKKRFTKIQSIG